MHAAAGTQSTGHPCRGDHQQQRLELRRAATVSLPPQPQHSVLPLPPTGCERSGQFFSPFIAPTPALHLALALTPKQLDIPQLWHVCAASAHCLFYLSRTEGAR